MELEQGWVTEQLCQGGPPCGHVCACMTSLQVWKRFSLESAENPPPTSASCGCPPLAETGAGPGCRQTTGSLQRRRGRGSLRTWGGATLHPSPLPCGPTSVWWAILGILRAWAAPLTSVTRPSGCRLPGLHPGFPGGTLVHGLQRVRHAEGTQNTRSALLPPPAPPASEKQKRLHTSPNVPWGTQSPLAEILVAWDSVPLASCGGGGHESGKDGAGRSRGGWSPGRPPVWMVTRIRCSDPSTPTS